MNILHIWNTAGVGSMIANEQRKMGHHVHVLMRHPFDPFGFTQHYGFEYMDTDANTFLNYAFQIAKNYDVIHFHAIDRLMLKYRTAFPNKILIIHHHGTEVTKKPNDNLRHLQNQHADLTFASTPDVHNQLRIEGIKSIYIPNPIDTDLFRPLEQKRPLKKYLFVKSNYIDMDSVFRFLEDKIDINQMDVFDREKDGIPFYDMPKLFSKYETFVDVKCYSWLNGEAGRAYSTTGLQASACGLKVLNYDGQLVSDIHVQHDAKNVAKLVLKNVEKCMEK